MHTSPTTPANTWTKASRIIVDWSQEPQRSDDAVKVNDLMEWVRTYPQRSAVHVVLRRSRLMAKDRRLQSALQSLGCTVTMRSHQPVGV